MVRGQRFRLTLPGRLDRSDLDPRDPAALTFLREAEVVAGWLMPNASNYTFLVELCRGEQHGYGIYKPQAGEALLWDFPAGTLYLRECATYAISQLIGWELVPPTVACDGELGPGSLQLYVPPVPGSHFFNLRSDHPHEVLRMAVFDLIVNNADRKGGHCLQAQCGGIWGIDHGLTFHVAHKLRTVIWDFGGECVPDSLLRDVQSFALELALPGSLAKATLMEWISRAELDALVERVERLIRDPVLPVPHSRRDIPWPYI